MFYRAPLSLLLILGLCIHGASSQEVDAPPPEAGQADPQAEEEDSDWGLNSLRGSFEAVNGYFDSMLELLGGRDGVCQYRCRFGESRSKMTLDLPGEHFMDCLWVVLFIYILACPIQTPFYGHPDIDGG